MKKRNKIIILPFAFLCIALGIAIIYLSSAEGLNSENNQEVVFDNEKNIDYIQAGIQLNDLLTKKKDNTIVVKAKDFNITQYEVDIKKIFYQSSGSKDPLTDAINECIRLKSLYYEAEKQGFTATHNEIENDINKTKEMLKNCEDNELKQYLNQFDDEELFWDYNREIYSINLTIKKYLTDNKTQFLKENNLDDTAESQEKWLESESNLEKELINAQHAEIIK